MFWWPHDARMLFFFFSSRRRHTRLVSDWSSDVCSSDLGMRAVLGECPRISAGPPDLDHAGASVIDPHDPSQATGWNGVVRARDLRGRLVAVALELIP